MRTTRTLLTLALAALAALAFAATANATTENIAEVVTEPDGVHCGAISPEAPVNEQYTTNGEEATGGCPIHAEGEVELEGVTIFGHIPTSNCLVDLEGRVNGQGEGWIQSAALTPHVNGQCVREPCEGDNHAMEAWPAHAGEEGGQLYIAAEFCVVPTNSDHTSVTSCEVEVPFNENPTHNYTTGEFDVNGQMHVGPVSQCEIDGFLSIDGTGLEVIHTDPQ